MENIMQILKRLDLEKNITLDDIPNIDLYMDQVIQLFESVFNSTRRDENEKVLTKTMINNYAKGGLFFPIKNKKYSKEHLLLISLIYQLKGTLSIQDIKAVLAGINKKISEEEFTLDAFYNSYIELTKKNVSSFYDEIPKTAESVKKELEHFTSDKDANYLEKALLITSLVHMSSLYRRVVEKLVDSIIEEQSEEKPKNK
ncbi:DUF1836 domain-containing protein [Bacillus kwashiorkori]|uniref:DUF1836 domain-containing protein n=1 Tax=Bacillus kwashiorkori TaxID=1522318 RepID=UPI0007821594|nr:DUF1836 domain-containing protein [Bacillus kwashiorkori]